MKMEEENDVSQMPEKKEDSKTGTVNCGNGGQICRVSATADDQCWKSSKQTCLFVGAVQPVLLWNAWSYVGGFRLPLYYFEDLNYAFLRRTEEHCPGEEGTHPPRMAMIIE
ncbi:hypothetical protein J6590_016625 [Homalodisca vitripennis]|nr:hypothetical protein J6590_016625 [Homalodisca vitripennis]